MPYKYKVDEKFFDEWTREMAYVLGWIYADGTLRKNRYQFKIASNDWQALVNIRRLLKSSHQIKEEPRKERINITKVLVIDSKKLYKRLCELGLTPNKSKVMKLPRVPNKFFPDFLRGYLEGDGTIHTDIPNKRYSKYTRLKVRFYSGSQLFLEGLQKRISELFGTKSKLTRRDHSGFDIAYSTYEALRILTIIYKDTTKLFRLERKFFVYKSFLKEFRFIFN